MAIMGVRTVLRPVREQSTLTSVETRFGWFIYEVDLHHTANLSAGRLAERTTVQGECPCGIWRAHHHRHYGPRFLIRP